MLVIPSYKRETITSTRTVNLSAGYRPVLVIRKAHYLNTANSAAHPHIHVIASF
jgi:hypothetical protein